MDSQAKLRSRLLRSRDTADLMHARAINRETKLQFRSNLRQLRKDLGDCVLGFSNQHQMRNMSRALERNRDSVPLNFPLLNPDHYTSFMESLQPNPESTSKVTVHKFNFPKSFLHILTDAITSSMKLRKEHGPDRIRIEVLRLSPTLFVKASMQVWITEGRIVHMPEFLRLGTLVPIYTQSGDSSLPNNRPTCLVSVFRKLIAAALSSQIKETYEYMRFRGVSE